jgi:hypothetical protein
MAADEERWQRQWAAVIAHKQATGYWPTIRQDEPELAPLSHWIRFQRVQRRRGRLPADREAALLAAGLDFDPPRGKVRRPPKPPKPKPKKAAVPSRSDRIWNERWGQVQAFHDQHGRWPGMHGDPAEESLRRWTVKQRQHARQGRLSPERVKALLDARFQLLPRPAHLYTAEQRAKAVADYQRGVSMAAIERRDGTSTQTLRNWLAEAGVRPRPVGRPREQPPNRGK